MLLSVSDKDDDDSSVCAIGFVSSPETISPSSSLLSGKTDSSLPMEIGFSDDEKSSPFQFPRKNGKV